MNRFLAETFASAGIGCDNINWYKALVVWDSILDEASVANFFLLDLFEEIESPGKNLSLSRLNPPPTILTETVKICWVDLIGQVWVTWPDYVKKKEELIKLDGSGLGYGYLDQTISPLKLKLTGDKLAPGPWGGGRRDM
jgi:hypothetical protein